jgi:hypothetical protein
MIPYWQSSDGRLTVLHGDCRDGNREYQREWQRSRRAPAARPREEAAS